LSAVKAKREKEDKRTQELVGILQEQQEYTRAALLHHKQLAKSLQRQKNPGVVSTTTLTLKTTKQHENYTGEMAGQRNLFQLQLPELCYEQHRPEVLEHPRKSVLATVNFDARMLSSSPQIHSSAVDSTSESFSVSTDSEEEPSANSEADDDSEHSEQIQKRLGDRQREVFANNVANGVFLGGGFIAKKSNGQREKKIKPNLISNKSTNRPTSECEFLETVLDAHSASILSLAQANKPALRRREASEGRRHPNSTTPQTTDNSSISNLLTLYLPSSLLLVRRHDRIHPFHWTASHRCSIANDRAVHSKHQSVHGRVGIEPDVDHRCGSLGSGCVLHAMHSLRHRLIHQRSVRRSFT
ncbi:hypothetical protein PHMEG_00017853, partial [Phytophthora megakarya]